MRHVLKLRTPTADGQRVTNDGTDVAVPELPAFEALGSADFETAANAVLRYLRSLLGFSLWMVTRTDGDDWIVLAAEDGGYGVEPGHLFRWSDSFCSRMVAGEGPRVAPTSALVPSYREAPIGRQVPIGAYVGVPIPRSDGGLFGTLCAIDPAPQPDAIARHQPLIELLAGLLGNVLAHERDVMEERRRAERAEAESKTDGLTGLANRRAWESFLDLEEERCRRYGDPASILALDLDGLKEVNDNFGHASGDELLRRAARLLEDGGRESDLVARLGGDEFGILAVHCSADQARSRGARLTERLEAERVAASLGIASRHPSRGLRDAWELADARMYEAKRRLRAVTVDPT